MNTSVGDEFFERESCNLASYGIETRKRNDVGSVVDDEVNARCAFKSADISSHTADDPSLHLVVGQSDDRNGVFGCGVRGAALNRLRDDVLSLFDCVVFCFLNELLCVVRTALFHAFEKCVFKFLRSLFFGHAGNSFEFLLHFFLSAVEFVFDAFQALFGFFDLFLRPFYVIDFFVESGVFLVKSVLLFVERSLFLSEAIFGALPVLLALFGFVLEINAHFVHLFFSLEHTVFANGFCFEICFFDNSCRFTFCVADFVLRIDSINDKTDQSADDNRASRRNTCSRARRESRNQKIEISGHFRPPYI